MGPTPIRVHRPHVPASLAVVLDRLLEADPANRYATPIEVIRALEPFAVGCDLPALLAGAAPAEGEAAAAEAVRPGDSTPSRPPRPKAGARSWIPFAAKCVLAAALVAAAAVGVALFVLRPEIPRPPPVVPPAPSPFAGLGWPEDYPALLRDRPWGQPIDLLSPVEGPDLTNRPIWNRRLAGSGRGSVLPGQFAVTGSRILSNPGCTVLALDDDLARRWFEFKAEAQTVQGSLPIPARGIFFGWKPVGRDQIGAYFVDLQEVASGAPPVWQGRLAVAYLSFPTAATQANGWVVPLDDLRGKPLAAAPVPVKRTAYHLRVRAEPGKLEVAVDGEPPLAITPVEDARGALGVWVQNGMAFFKRASETALPIGNDSP